MKHNGLRLRREVLSDLTEDDLRDLVGGTTKTTTVGVDPDTIYSCMTVISCAVPLCLINRETLLPCIVN